MPRLWTPLRGKNREHVGFLQLLVSDVTENFEIHNLKFVISKLAYLISDHDHRSPSLLPSRITSKPVEAGFPPASNSDHWYHHSLVPRKSRARQIK